MAKKIEAVSMEDYFGKQRGKEVMKKAVKFPTQVFNENSVSDSPTTASKDFKPKKAMATPKLTVKE